MLFHYHSSTGRGGVEFYVWENDFDEEENICDFYLSFFVKEENGTYRRFDEEHSEKAYNISEIKNLLSSAGFENIYYYNSVKISRKVLLRFS